MNSANKWVAAKSHRRYWFTTMPDPVYNKASLI